MDIDRVTECNDETEETYDTPLQLKELSGPFTQHQSAPALPSLTLQCDQYIHNSAPNLDNDASHCDLLLKKGNDLPANFWQDSQNYEDGFYMNTSLHAESRVLSRNNSLAGRVDSSCNIAQTAQPDNVHNIPNETTQSEEYYMAPPSGSTSELNDTAALDKSAPPTVDVDEGAFYDEIPHVSDSEPLIQPPLAPNIERVVAARQQVNAFYDEPSKAEGYHGNLPLLHPSMIRHVTPSPGLSTMNCDPSFYDEPGKGDADSVHGSLPPLPTFNMDDQQDSAEMEESFYEGINDNDIGDLYEGLGEDNFYEGLEAPTDKSPDGHHESEMSDFYEGIGETNYETEFSLTTQEDTSLNRLIDSLGKTDTPYVPPKPPPVPFRSPSKAFKPLPDIPQYQPFDPAMNYSKMVPQSIDAPCLSPVIDEVVQSKIATNGKLLSSPREPSVCSEASSEGFYDGIDMISNEGEEEEDRADDEGGEKKNEKTEMRRSYSVMMLKKSVSKTRHKTAQQLGTLKEAITHSISSKKSKWKDSKARNEMKTVLKETKTKATELKANTETMYNVLQRRASKSWKKSTSRRVQQKSLSGEDTTGQASAVLEMDAEFEEPLGRGEDFKSINTENVASSFGSKYYDLEASGSSEHRSSLTSETHGVRVRNTNSAVSSTYLADTSLSPSLSGMHADNSMVVVTDPLVRELSHDLTTSQEEGDNAAASSGLRGDQKMGVTALEVGGVNNGAAAVSGVNSQLSYLVTDRHKVLQQILDHEYRYIMSLKDMMKVYAAPLQHSQANKALIDPAKAQEIFFRIPEITVHHEFFYEQLRRRSMSWSKHQSLGDILLQLFHKPGLFSAYASYMDNFNHALEIVLDARAARPAFSRFLDKLRSKSNQLSLEDLIYLPVDHIPVYLELLQELIKQTTQDDPDYTYLYLAKDEITKLMEKLNERKHQAEKSFSVKVLEKKITGLPCSLIAPQRYIISRERVRELDILTERSDDRHLVILSDMVLCLKPLSRAVTTNVISTGVTTEYQYLWDALITDVELNVETDTFKPAVEESAEDSDGYQALKDDLMILEQIDMLRKQLKSSYSVVRFDKLAEVQARLRREIAERQSSAESRRGKTLKVTRPVNSPCTSTQFHQFLFSSVAKRSQWRDEFLQRQRLMQHTKGLDWCQIGESEVVSQERLSTLLPIIKHMTPIGLTTPTFFSVECAAANADFTCPVTQDILYRIMSKGDEQYENSTVPEQIPILPPGQSAPLQDTPLYEVELALPVPAANQQPVIDHVTAPTGHVTTPQAMQPLPVINPLATSQDDNLRRPSVPSLVTSRSPFAVTSSVLPPPLPGRSFSADASASNTGAPPSLLPLDGDYRSRSFDSAVPNLMSPPPLPGNHPLIDSAAGPSLIVPNNRHTIIEMIENVPKEFNIDDRETVDDVYETPYEISLLREEKRKLMRSMSVDETSMDITSLRDREQTITEQVENHTANIEEKSSRDFVLEDTPSSHAVTPSDTPSPHAVTPSLVISGEEEEESQPLPSSVESQPLPSSVESQPVPSSVESGAARLDRTSESSVSIEMNRPRIDSIDMSSLDYPSLPSLPAEEAPASLQLQSLQSDIVQFSTPPSDSAALVKPLDKFANMNLSEFPDDSFNLELTDSKAISSFISPQKNSMMTSKSDGGNSGAPLLVDKYGQVYTDKITSLISGPGTISMDSEVPLPDLDKKSVDLSLIELESEDEDDSPNVYDSELNLDVPLPDDSLPTGLSVQHASIPHHSSHQTSTTLSAGTATPVCSNSLNASTNSSDTTAAHTSLPNIVVPTSVLEQATTTAATTSAATTTTEKPAEDNLYENVASATQQLRTKVIRRESSKRSLNRGPHATGSRVSLVSENWMEQDPYENLDESTGDFELKSTDVFLCGHGQTGTGEIVVLRLTEPTPHIALNIPLKSRQVLSCHMVPGRRNTLWVGTQDARLLVYQMEDPSSSLLELDLDGGPVICISHIEDAVFVGTSEGFLHAFTRDETVNEWCDNDPITKKLGNSSICAMLPIGDHMWCSCGSQIFVISPRNVTVEHLFSTHNNTSAQVYKMVNCGSGVWLAIRNSPVIRLFHAKTGEHLEDYDISTVVHHLFTGSLSAAQRRRAENVRVTALLASASTGALWIGTSSGVIVVVPISKPPVAPKICGPPFLSYMGHYDGVRFLMQAQSKVKKLIAAESNDQETVFEEITSQVVVSCGKGMEDFRDLESNSNQTLDDSQNSSYLIVWHYPSHEDNT